MMEPFGCPKQAQFFQTGIFNMILNKINQEIISRRQTFNPNSKKHLQEFAYFLQNNKWKNVCPFFLEWPYLTIPDMVKDKVIRNILDKN